MGNWRKSGRLLLLSAWLAAGATFLTSCAQGQAHVTVHWNGTADLDLGLSVSEKTLQLIGKPDLMDTLAEALKRADLDTRADTVDGEATLHASRRFDLKHMDEQPYELPDGIEVEHSSERHFWYRREKIAVTMDMDKLLSSQGGDWSQKLTKLPLLARKLVERQFQFDFLLTLPIKPGENNADETSDGGRTQQWHLALLGANRIETSVNVPDIGHIAYVGGGALIAAALGLGAYAYRRRKKKKGG